MSTQIVNSYIVSAQEVERLSTLKEQVSKSFESGKLGDDSCVVIFDPNDVEKQTTSTKSNSKQVKSQKLPYKHACVALFGQVIPAFHYSKESRNLSSLNPKEYKELTDSKEFIPKPKPKEAESKETAPKDGKSKTPTMNYLKGNYVLNEDLIKAFNLDSTMFESERKKLSLSTTIYPDRIGKGTVKVTKDKEKKETEEKSDEKPAEKTVDKIFKHVKSTAQFTHVDIAWKIIFNMRKDIAESVMLMTYKKKPNQLMIGLKMIQHEESSSATLDYGIYGVEKNVKKVAKDKPAPPPTYKLVKYADEDKLNSVTPDKLCYSFRLQNPTDKKLKITQVAIKRVLGIEDAKAKVEEMSKFIPRTFAELSQKLGLKPATTSGENQVYEATKVIELLVKQNAEKESKKDSKKDGSGKGSRSKTSDSKPLNKPAQKTVQLSDINDQVDESEGVVEVPDLDETQEDENQEDGNQEDGNQDGEYEYEEYECEYEEESI
jgi:hypothetical protein